MLGAGGVAVLLHMIIWITIFNQMLQDQVKQSNYWGCGGEKKLHIYALDRKTGTKEHHSQLLCDCQKKQ